MEIGKLENRNFNDWTMGFKQLKSDETEIPEGYFRLDDEIMNRPETETAGNSLGFLKTFYTMQRRNGF